MNDDIFIIDLETLERVRIQFIPHEIVEPRSLEVNNIIPIGRNIPDYGFAGGEDSLEMVLDFFSVQEDRKDVLDTCSWLKSLTYSSNVDTVPSEVKLVFGELYRDQKWNVQVANVVYSGFVKTRGLLPQQARVEIRLIRSESKLFKSDVAERRING